MRRAVTSRHWPRRRSYRAFRLWQRYGPLGNCDECRTPTWNPVTFQIQHNIGRSGHYYCERCGPPIREAAEILGEMVVDR